MTKQISILLPPQVMPEGTVTWAAGEPLRALAQRVLPSVTLMLPLRFQQPLGPEVYTNLLLVEGSGQPAYGRGTPPSAWATRPPSYLISLRRHDEGELSPGLEEKLSNKSYYTTLQN